MEDSRIVQCVTAQLHFDAKVQALAVFPGIFQPFRPHHASLGPRVECIVRLHDDLIEIAAGSLVAGRLVIGDP